MKHVLYPVYVFRKSCGFEAVKHKGANPSKLLRYAYVSNVVKCALGEVEVDVTVGDLKERRKLQV
jgi:hypothetical protein